jgi:hypothetical protein
VDVLQEDPVVPVVDDAVLDDGRLLRRGSPVRRVDQVAVGVADLDTVDRDVARADAHDGTDASASIDDGLGGGIPGTRCVQLGRGSTPAFRP